ncbi:hypothetical protein COLO4_32057 [Corchorus olitorius]|uniref:Uncharacterized protein n=1 Tax=Corchorus olitorius TaxID=93759 RepID=A0A1R3H228_9ROSI|nr:hypothetical protein COLO4_32057 [Corchorus olitorius]
MAWLDLHSTDLPTVTAAKNLLNHPGVLQEIYSRGLADHFPPIFTLINLRPERKFIQAETNYTIVNLRETRSVEDIPGLAAATPHHSTLYSLQPICFVGGLRIMYNNRFLNAEIMNMEGQSFTAQLSFPAGD